MQEQRAEEQKEEEESYFTFFDKETNNGVVFDEDLSILPELPVDSLTNVEQTARQNWRTVRSRIEDHYRRPRFLSDTNELLKERLVAPSLVTHYASTRSKPATAEARAGRQYPVEIFSWGGFAQGLAEFVQPNRQLSENPDSVFASSLRNGSFDSAKRDKREEEFFLVNLLNRSLHRHGLVGKLTSWGPTVGRPDIVMTSVCDGAPRKEDVTVLAEFKSTHNLTLPMSAANVCLTYNNAYGTNNGVVFDEDLSILPNLVDESRAENSKQDSGSLPAAKFSFRYGRNARGTPCCTIARNPVCKHAVKTCRG